MPLRALWAKGCRGRPLPLRLWKIWDGGFWLRSLSECICQGRGRRRQALGTCSDSSDSSLQAWLLGAWWAGLGATTPTWPVGGAS